MNKIFTFCLAVLAASVFAQAPNKMSYQAVVRNSSNSLLINQAVGMRISLLQGSASGTSVYTETQSPTTNANGLVSIEIGGGTVVSGNFANINWANGPYFIKTETDPNGGTNYSITGTSQLLSVPYALFSNNIKSSVSSTGDTLFIGSQAYIIPGISAANSNNGGGQTGISTATCGADSVHNPNLNYGSMTDQDGNVYKTIVIGTQEWMAENLKVSHYRNGQAIALVTNATTWGSLSTGATCWYNNDSATYHCPYGKLYNWYAVADSRHVCPSGWHEPSDAEWNILVKQLDPAADTTCISCNQSTIAGGKMKSTGTQYWTSYNLAANNSSGFSGLPGADRRLIIPFTTVGNGGGWWSSTELNNTSACNRALNYTNGDVGRYNNSKRVGFSVRCLRD